jgi:ATP-dependent helicase HrpB
LVVAELQAPTGIAGHLDGNIRLAATIDRSDVDRIAGDDYRTTTRLEWDPQADDLRSITELVLGELVLEAKSAAPPVGAPTVEALVAYVGRTALSSLGWTPAARSLQDRVAWARRVLGDHWPDLSDAALAASAPVWLPPLLPSARGRRDLARVDPLTVMRGAISGLTSELDRLVPVRLALSSGRHYAIDYSGDQPRVAARVQEFFGTTTHPAVANGRIPITVELLSPAGRPIQITSDLPRFWVGSWKTVRREMVARYPKHQWPDDPSTAGPPPRSGSNRAR